MVHQGLVMPKKTRTTAATSKASDRARAPVNDDRGPARPALEAAVNRTRQELLRQLPKEMTTTQAAEFLDVSRPFLVKLVERGELPCRMVGTHRRIPSQALAEYRTKMFRAASAAADEMARISQDLGLYESETPPRGGT
jgi:excisionase family DNA binding protein